MSLTSHIAVSIPSVGLEMEGGPHAGKFTNIETLLDGFVDDLQKNAIGASVQLLDFIQSLCDLKFDNSMPWTLTIKDPLASSYIAGLEDSSDELLTFEDYERTKEEHERWLTN